MRSLLKKRAENIPFENGVKSKVWGLYRNRLQKPENGAGEAMHPPKIGFSKEKHRTSNEVQCFLVENSGIEPLTSCMPCKRSPS